MFFEFKYMEYQHYKEGLVLQVAEVSVNIRIFNHTAVGHYFDSGRQRHEIEVPHWSGEGNSKICKRIGRRVASELSRLERNATEKRFHDAYSGPVKKIQKKKK